MDLREPPHPAVLYDTDGPVATVTLNRPEQRNALSPDVIDGLGDALERGIDDPAIRAVLITNTGTTFCAGAFRKEPPPTSGRRTLVAVLETILDADKPVVGRIAGHCVGAGVGLAAACDLSIGLDHATFAFPEVRLGLAPAVISVVCLPKLRRADAMELFLTGDRITAARAAALGLINRAVAPDRFDADVSAVLATLVALRPDALAVAKHVVLRVPGMERNAAFAWTTDLISMLTDRGGSPPDGP